MQKETKNQSILSGGMKQIYLHWIRKNTIPSLTEKSEKLQIYNNMYWEFYRGSEYKPILS